MRISDIATGKNSKLAKIAASLSQREEERKVYIIYHKDLPPKVEVENPAILAIPAIFLDGDLANPDHPAACPFNTGGHTPAGCRWKPSLFYEAIATGALPEGCPFRMFCTPTNK